MQLDNWDDLKFVLAMTRHGTMSAAARHLATNVATVSRRLDRMSRALGVPLFEKRGAGLVPTRAAEDLAVVADDLDQTLRGRIADIRTGRHDEPVPLVIAAPPAVHRRFLLPRARDLSAHLPHVLLTLADGGAAQGLGAADILVRIGRPEGGRLRARKFRDYAQRVYHRRDRPLDDDWIGLTPRHREADRLRALHLRARLLPRYRVDDIPMAFDLALETGLPALLPDFMVEPGHGLVAADLPDNGLPGELWIAYHETRHGDSTLRAVVDRVCGPTSAGVSDDLAESRIRPCDIAGIPGGLHAHSLRSFDDDAPTD